jgi:hypothetical protein
MIERSSKNILYPSGMYLFSLDMVTRHFSKSHFAEQTFCQKDNLLKGSLKAHLHNAMFDYNCCMQLADAIVTNRAM